jgi:Uncharacterised protein family (UPF0158)
VVRLHRPDVDADSVDDLDDAGLIHIDPLPSSVGYDDMDDFIERVRDRRARELLKRAIERRGAFRRFKDLLFELPELRDDWFAFRDVRACRHAIEWRRQRGLVSDQQAAEALVLHDDPLIGGPDIDLSGAVAADPRELYGSRLVTVLVFGSRARATLIPTRTSTCSSSSRERSSRGLSTGGWRRQSGATRSRSGTLVSALPVARARSDDPDEPVLLRARAESVPA